MSIITAISIGILFLGYIVLQFGKNFFLRKINTSLLVKEYDAVETIVCKPIAKKLLGEYTCDIYQLQVYYQTNGYQKFDCQLNNMIHKEYKNTEDKKYFLELYFHTFLLKKNEKYAELLLDALHNLEDKDCSLYNQQAYEVMIHQKDNLIGVMHEEIDSKRFYGFSLGVILFMIARQYEYLENSKKALLYYQNAKVCFHPNTVYIPIIIQRIKELDTEGDKK